MAGESKYFEPYFETMPRDELRELQNKKLRRQVARGYMFAPAVKELFDKLGITPSDIRTVEDLQEKVPVMYKDVVRERRAKTGDPFGGFLAVPEEEVYSVQHSTGTTGLPTFIAKTKKDIEGWITRQYARHAWAAGARPGDRILVWGYYWHAWLKDGNDRGFAATGAQVWEFSSMPTPTDIERLHMIASVVRFQGVNHGTLPMFRWMDYARAKGIDPRETYHSDEWKFIRTEGDMLTEPVRKYSREFWGTIHLDASGGGDCVVATAENRDQVETGNTKGLMIWEDFFFVEVVDPKTHEVVADGEKGEYVITPLDYEAMVYLRWDYEDMVIKDSSKDVSGRTHATLKYLGRTLFGALVKGKHITQRDVEEILYSFPEVMLKPWQFIKSSKDLFKEEDKLRIRAVYDPNLTKDPEELRNRIAKALEEKLGVPAEVEWIPEEEVRTLPHKVYKLYIRSR